MDASMPLEFRQSLVEVLLQQHELFPDHRGQRVVLIHQSGVGRVEVLAEKVVHADGLGVEQQDGQEAWRAYALPPFHLRDGQLGAADFVGDLRLREREPLAHPFEPRTHFLDAYFPNPFVHHQPINCRRPRPRRS